MRLHILHHHLRPGGVTDVIRAWVQLLQRARSIDEIRLYCGRENDLIPFERELKHTLCKPFSIHSDPVFDYRPQPFNETDIVSLASYLEETYIRSSPESLWWVHNYHLGKNPLLTGALLRLMRNSDQRFLLQIHDFPECGRFEAWQTLTALGGLYPVCSNVRYAAVNYRDYEILTRAGIPPKQLFSLPNPLGMEKEERPPDPTNPKNRQSLTSALQRICQTEGYRFRPDRSIVLYPVRSIRRKNVLEAGVWNLLAGEPANVLVTLPGVSAAEHRYSELVTDAYRAGLIQGACRIGPALETKGWDFSEWRRLAGLYISTSLLEGFGYTYFHPVCLGIPLFARKTDVLNGFEDCFPPEYYFYRTLHIPLQAGRGGIETLREELLERYRTYSRKLPAPLSEILWAEIQKKLAPGQDSLDFAYLPPDQQYRILEKLSSDPDYRSETAALNADAVHRYRELAAGPAVPSADTQLWELFSPASLVRRFETILESTPDRRDTDPYSQKTDIGENVLLAFTRLEYHLASLWY